MKLGVDDAELVFGTGLPEATERLLASGARAVLGTAGAAGAALVGRGRSERTDLPVSPAPGAIVDTLGAGDATFTTVVAALVADESDPVAVLGRAMAIAAATIRAPGGMLRLPV